MRWKGDEIMGFWKKLFKRKKASLEGKPTIQEYLGAEDAGKFGKSGYMKLEVQKAYRMSNEEECSEYIKNLQEQKKVAKRQLSELKEEYARVGSVLNDVLKIEAIEAKDREELFDAATKIDEINKERKKFQSTESKISEKQYRKMEEYGESIRSMMAQLDEDEKYAHLLEQDMRHLEAEKTSIRYEKDELHSKKTIAKKAVEWAVVLLGISIIFYMVCIILLQEHYENFMYIMFGVVGILLTITFLVYQNASSELRLADRKLNKAILLLNRVKARYVMILNSVQYQYAKYEVNSAYELNYIWGLYLEEKKNREKYRASSDRLHEAEMVMIGILSEYMVEQPRFWVSYVTALLDSREMVEVRHDLNGRRKMLRESMEGNRNFLEMAETEKKKLAVLNPEYAQVILARV